jgi:hypothetical protein
MSLETSISTLERQPKVGKFGRELEAFAVYPPDFARRAKKSVMNRIAGRLSVGTASGKHATPESKRDIRDVQTQKALDRELGVSLLDRVQEQAKQASEETGVDLDSGLSSMTVDEHGVRRILTIGVHREVRQKHPRLQYTHGDMKDSLDFRITTLGSEPGEVHTIGYSVGLNGEVSLIGPEGDKSKVHHGSDAAERMLADLDSFPDPRHSPEVPF